MIPNEEFERFVAASSPSLLRMAYLLTGSADRAQDLVQSVFERMWRRWSSIDSDTALSYARRVMTNLHTDWLRRRPWLESSWAEPPDAPARSDALTPVDDRSELAAALRQLSARERAVIVLRYYVDLSEADTAATLGVPVGTVKSLAARGLKAVRATPSYANSTSTPDRRTP